MHRFIDLPALWGWFVEHYEIIRNLLRNNSDMWLEGISNTLMVGLPAILLGLLLGILLAGISQAKFRPIAWLFRGYIGLFSNTPVLLQLLFAYYALATPTTSTWKVSVIVLTLNIGAHCARLMLDYRAPQFSREELPPNTFGDDMSRAWPALSNHIVVALLSTSICSMITLSDLTRTAQEIVQMTFILDAFVVAAAIYLIIAVLLRIALRLLGKALFIEPK